MPRTHRWTALGPAIAAVSTMGYVAFLGGPPLIGFLADAVGLPGALTVICLAAATVAVLGGHARAAERVAAPAQPSYRMPISD